MTLSFDGKTLREAGVDGPYVLDDLYIEHLDTGESLPPIVASTENLYTTTAYTARQFEGEPLTVAATAELAEDTNGNGLYDRLAISVTFDVLTPGDFHWLGSLVDAEGNLIGDASGAGRLDAQTPAEFVFTGGRVAASRRNGPYRLTDVYVTTAGGNALSYTVMAQQPPGATIVSRATSHWFEGGQTQELIEISGQEIAAAGLDGPFLLKLEAVSYDYEFSAGASTSLNRAQELFTTQAYSATQFQTFPVVPLAAPTLSPPTDDDHDGVYTVTWSAVAGAINYELMENHNDLPLLCDGLLGARDGRPTNRSHLWPQLLLQSARRQQHKGQPVE